MDEPTRILVVDDDPALRWTTARVLERAGYHVDVADTGEEGLRLASETKPALVLLDVVLPGIDGLEVCRRIKADPDPDTPHVLLFSGHRVDTLEQAAGLEGGADGYIIRPVSNRELLARVAAILRLKRTEDELRARTEELAQRVRELDCLYAVAHLAEQDLSLTEKLEAAARLLPSAWKAAEVTCSRVTLDGVDYPPIGCVESPWKLVAPLSVDGHEAGRVQLCYSQERTASDEERRLLHGVADHLQRMIVQARVEESLHWSEERFRAVFQQARDGIALIDHDGIVIEWNAAMERITGRSAASVLGRPLWDVELELSPPAPGTPVGRDPVRESIAQAIENGQADWLGQTVEREYHHPGGATRTLSATFFRIETPGRFLLGNVVRDVTERRQAEVALGRESAANAAMASLASALIHMAPVEDISKLVLDHACRLTGSADGFAGYIDSITGSLVLPAIAGDVRDGCQLTGQNCTFEHFRGLWGWVIEHREPLLTNSPGEDSRACGTPAGHIPIDRFLAVPAIVNDVLVGEIALANSHRDYTSFDLELAERLASLYAVAIQRSHTERALRDSERRFRSLLESAPDAILLVDEQGRVAFVNAQAEASFGYARAELLGQAVEVLVPEGVRDAHKARREEYGTRTTLRPVSVPPALNALRKDGTRFPVDVKLSPLVMDAEVLMTAIIRDVSEREDSRAALQRAHDELEARVGERTAELAEANRGLMDQIARRRKAETALRASEARFREIAAHIDEALWMTDAETGEFLYVSPVFMQMAGIPEQEVTSDPSPLMMIVHPEDRERVATALATRADGYDLECRLLREDESVRWVRIRSFPIRDLRGRVHRVAGLAQDITAERETQAAMVQNERLAMAGKLAASLAHEINNPLQSAIGCLDLVQESLETGEDPNPFLSVVQQEMERTARIVAQLRTLSRPAVPHDREPVDLHTLLDQVLVLAGKQLASAVIRVDRRFAAELPELLLCPDEMRQVFLNLVLNAVDAMPEGGVLEVSTGLSDPEGVAVRFTDTGGGIDPATMKQLFDPFYSTKAEGLGLGLFISQSIVRAHGGRISVDNEMGEGASFAVWLPLGPPDGEGIAVDGGWSDLTL